MSESNSLSSRSSPHKESLQEAVDHNKLNFIRYYSIPDESQFKCHFVLKKIFMPRKESIEDYFARLVKVLTAFGPVAILQMSNVYKNQLVDVDVGMTYDKDAAAIVTQQLLVKLWDRQGKEVSIKPLVSTVFMMYLQRSQSRMVVQKGTPNKHTQAITSIQEEEKKREMNSVNHSQTVKYDHPSQAKIVVRIIGIPKQYGVKQLLQALQKEKISVRQSDIRDKEEAGMIYYEVPIQKHRGQSLLECGLQLRGIPLLVMQSKQVALKWMLSEYQVRITASGKQKIMAKAIFQIFRKIGTIVNLFQFNSNGHSFLLTFSKKRSVQQALTQQLEGIKVAPVDKNQAFRLQRISVKSHFYNYLRLGE